MKIQVDTENKTIQLEKEVVLSKLIETLEKLLPIQYPSVIDTIPSFGSASSSVLSSCASSQHPMS